MDPKQSLVKRLFGLTRSLLDHVNHMTDEDSGLGPYYILGKITFSDEIA